MHLLNLILRVYLLTLLVLGSNPVFLQTSPTMPPGENLVERELFFSQQITDEDSQRAISPDGNLMAIVNQYKLQIWNLTTKRLFIERAFNRQNALPTACAFSASGEQVIIYTKLGDLTVFDLTTREFSASWSSVTYASPRLSFAIKDNVDYGKVFATDQSEENTVAQLYSDLREGIAFSSNERYLLVGNRSRARAQVFDLEQEEMVFEDSIVWQYGWESVICNTGRRFAMSKWPRSSELVLATLIDQDSAVIVSTELVGDPRNESIYFTFSHHGRYLCVLSTRADFRIYDCDNDFAIVYEDAAVKEFSADMVIDSSYITYLKRDDFRIVLDQGSLEVVDTLSFSAGLALFDPQHRPVPALRSGTTLQYYNYNKDTVETLRRSLLARGATAERRYKISPNLMMFQNYQRVDAWAKFDLANLEPMNMQDSLEKHNHADIRPDSPYWEIYERNRKVSFSPRWKYKIQDAEISSWATEDKIMDLPFLAARPHNWRTVFTDQEDRVMFYNLSDGRVVVADLNSGEFILDQQYSILMMKDVLLSPAGNFVVIIGNNTSSLKVEWLDGKTVDFSFDALYGDGSSLINTQISPNGKWLQLYTYGKRFSEKIAAIWSIETGELVYQSDAQLVLIDSPTDVLLWSKDSLKRISTVTEEVRWSVPFEGEYYKMRAPVGAGYLTYVKDGYYYCLMDLSTGQELWQMGKRYDFKQGGYFVKSSQYPIVYTNYPPFLEHFHYEDSTTKETVYPNPESLRDNSQYLQRITREVLRIK